MSMDAKRTWRIFSFMAIALTLSQFPSILVAQTFATVPAISFTKPFAGSDPLPQIMMISSVGAPFSFTVASSTSTGGSWLSVTPGPGCCTTTPGSVTAKVTTLPTLAVGSYSGQIVITSYGGATTMTIPVNLTVTSTSTAFLDNLPGQASFTMLTGGSAVTSQDIQVRNAGTGSLAWTLTSTTSDGGGWLSVTSTAGTAPSFITVGVNPALLPGGGLTAGTFVGQLVFHTTASTSTVPISVTVGTDILSQVSPINFVKVFGGANPLPQVLMIPGKGAAVSYVVASSTAAGGAWLSVSPGPGCCSTTPNTVTATAAPSVTLPVGTYTAQIVVTTYGNTQAITIPATLTVVPAGGSYFNDLPGQMSFSVPTSGTTITSQDLEIRNGGAGTLSWTLTDSTSDTSPWLGVSITSGTAPSIISVSVNVANLPNGGLIAGTFIGQIVLKTASGRVTVPVAVTVAANVLSQVNPINFTKVFGGANPLPQTLTFPSTSASISYVVSSSTATGGAWLAVSPGPGCCSATPNTVTATVVASPTLAIGTYTGQIVVTSYGGGMTITVPATLTVTSASGPYFDNVPGQMSFAAIVATSNNPPSQVIALRNAGTGSLNWTLEATTSDGGNWLTASALSGTTPSNVSISVNRANLPGGGLLAGTFVGELVFRTAESSATVPVTFVLGANILAQVNAIQFTMPFGGNNPLPQTLSIPATGTAVSFLTTSSTATGSAWLSVSPGVGCCTSAPNTVTATVTASPALAVGTYTGQIVVTTYGGGQALTIPVTLTVAPAASAFFDNLPGQASFFIPTATGNPASQTIQVRNAGQGTLNWTATKSTSDGGNWLTISAASGTAPSNVTVGIVTSNLPNAGLIAGTFNGQIVFQTAGSTVTVPISAYVGTDLFVQAGALNFSKAFGAPNPLAQNITVSSTGAKISFLTTSATGNGGSWLSVSPGPGCCTATPHSVTASIIAPATLASGTYTGQIVITLYGGARAMTIPVTLTVGATQVVNPEPTSVSPPSGEASDQTLTFTFTGANGWQSLGVVDILLNNALDGRQACYVAFVPSGASSGSVYLVDDAGDAGGPYSGMVLPSGANVQNSQCTIHGTGSSVSASGNTLTLTLKYTFTAAFGGNKVFYMAAQDTLGHNSGWQALGTWKIPVAAGAGPGVVGMSPARTSTSSQTYTFTFTDASGWQDIGVTNILINSAIDGRHACYVAFVPSAANSGSLYLVDDAGDAGGPYSGMTLAGSATVQNSQCSISGIGSSVQGSGNTLILTLNITFTGSFTGNQLFFVAARNDTLNSDWQSVGSVTVP